MQPKADMVPKESRPDLVQTQPIRDSLLLMRELIQMQHFCRHGDTICHPNSTQLRNVYMWTQQ